MTVSPDFVDTMDVLEFWKEHSIQCPTLANLARGIYGIPASAAEPEVERLWSAAGRTVYRRTVKLELG